MSAKDTSVEDVLAAATGLLNQPGPWNPESVHNVLSVVRAKGDSSLTASILGQLRPSRAPNEEMQTFVRTSLADKSPVVRQAAVVALGRMSKEVRGKFASGEGPRALSAICAACPVTRGRWLHRAARRSAFFLAEVLRSKVPPPAPTPRPVLCHPLEFDGHGAGLFDLAWRLRT